MQDPTDRTVQFVVQQAGRIRVVRNGTVLATDFLNLTSSVVCWRRTGTARPRVRARLRVERPLLRQLHEPERRHRRRAVQRARRIRSSPIRGRDSTCMLGGHASLHHAAIFQSQRRAPGVRSRRLSLHRPRRRRIGQRSRTIARRIRASCSARCCASTSTCRDSDTSATGFRPTTRFSARHPARDEIWAFGLRNPWRYTFDDVARGGTGRAGDRRRGTEPVEEIDYEPRGAGGRNYGWRNREGAHDNVTVASAGISSADGSDFRIRPQRRRVGHRRLRVSRRAARTRPIAGAIFSPTTRAASGRSH